MRGLTRAIVPLGLVVMAAVPAWAQGQGRGFGRGFGGPALLMNESVQQELKLDTNQVDKVRNAVEGIMEKSRESFAGLRDAAPEERRTRIAELNRTLMADTRAALKDVLKPEQIKRFEQITIQTRGLDALADPEIVEKLKLSSDQKAKIEELASELNEARRAAFQDQGGDRQAAFQRIRTLGRESMTKATALLGDDQKKTWEELVGKSFEIQFQPRNN